MFSEVMEWRWCKLGQHWMQEDQFPIDKRWPTSQPPWCMTCKAAYNRESYRANLSETRKKNALRQRLWRERQQKLILAEASKWP